MTWTDKDHDQQVLRIIAGYVDKSSDAALTVSENLGLAMAAIVIDRKTSSDLDFMPDASYYLQARYEISMRKGGFSKIVSSEGGIVLTYFYNMLKLAGNPLQSATGWQFLQTDKGTPNSDPTLSSVRWVKRGAYDGFRDNGSQVGKPTVPTSWPRSFMFGLAPRTL